MQALIAVMATAMIVWFLYRLLDESTSYRKNYKAAPKQFAPSAQAALDRLHEAQNKRTLLTDDRRTDTVDESQIPKGLL